VKFEGEMGKYQDKQAEREYFNKLYFSMAGREDGMDTWKCALTNISPEKLMFATDYPFNFDNDPQGLRECVRKMRKLDLPKKDIEGMLGGNAARLLGI
jgi:predicted TIM-barrel fold metal-dependent hydrolase